RGVDVAMLSITPFQYNPVTKELVVYKDLKLKVHFNGGNSQFGDVAYRNRWWDPILSDFLLNYSSLPKVDYDARYKKLAKTKDNPSDECEYIIITPTGPDFLAWADSIQRFRNQQGILTHVFTVDEVGGNTTSAIQSFIDNAYNNWTIKPVACLLLGDYGTDGTKNIISTLLVHPAGYPNFASDNIYADVDGDHLPDVVFSRITANDANQLQIMCTKFLSYERTPPTDPLFYDKPITCLGWQTERWFQLCSEVTGGYFRTVLNKHPRRINSIYQGTPGSIWSSNGNTSTLVNYFGPNGLGYIPQTPIELGGFSGGNATMINNAIDSGAFMLLHRDHGEYTGWGEPSYNTGNIGQLTNTLLPFVFSINCQTGAYHRSQECFAEKFHRHSINGHNAGAIGVTAPTEVSYSFVNDTYLWGNMDNMFPDFMPDGQTPPTPRGAMPAFGNAGGKYFLYSSSWPTNPGDKTVTYNLFHFHGDAFSVMYYEVPSALTVTHNTDIPEGDTIITVTANQNALIALTINNVIIATAVGNGNTPVEITIPPQTVGTQIVITVTKQNFYRYKAYIPVVPGFFADFTTSTNQVCTGNSVNFTDASTGEPTSWVWTFTGGNPATSTDQNPTVSYNTPGTYSVTLSITKGTSTDTETKDSLIEVFPQAIPDFSVETACAGIPATFTDQSNPNGGTLTSWAWDFGDPASGSSNTSTEQNPVHAFSAAGTYNVLLQIVNNNLCGNTVSKSVAVMTIPDTAAVPTGQTEVCIGTESIPYHVDEATYASSYVWEVSPAEAGTITGTTQDALLNASSAYTGTATIRVKGVNTCGEGVFSDVLSLDVKPIPGIAATPAGPDSVDVNKITTSDFTTAGASDATIYQWVLNPVTAGTISGDQLTGTVTWNNQFKGDATISVTGSSAWCAGTTSDVKTVHIYSTLGINEIGMGGIEIFPNPTHGILTVKFNKSLSDNLSIRVFNILGNPVLEKTDLNISKPVSQSIDISKFSEGVYYLRIENKSQIYTCKVVLQK
ncbi:MAG: C25 family cysteine peptidase, partial [Bacteroidota bacterium]|nr:C25 family cysteine peptidase [Bacteroidota bacterium]